MTFPDNPPDDDDALWQWAMRDVGKLPASTGKTDRISFKKPENFRLRKASEKTASPPPDLPHPRARDLDRRTEQRFRQGRMEIEARLDLHGMTLAKARAAVHDFIRRHHAAGTRCVLIITGKGKTETVAGDAPWYETGRGGIRRDFTRWLEAPDLSPLILSVSPARAAHGGAGAFYVLLRRKR